MIDPTSPCPCGGGGVFGQCCLPVHRGERPAVTAEQLMRSRYSAYAVGDADYIWRTWHPRTRPPEVAPMDTDEWVELEILDVIGGQPGDEWGEVEFRARHRAGVLHERSRFSVRARRWFYLDGELVGERKSTIGESGE